MVPRHWTEQLFLEHSDVFLRIHEFALDKAEAQARDVHAILTRGGIAPGVRILDAPCGIGRHSVHLAKMGYRVTGLDIAPLFLDRASRLAAAVGSTPEFVRGDLRNICESLEDRQGSYAAILNLWTSIGYWGEEVDREIFRQFHTLAAPNALLVVDTVNHDFLVKYFARFGREEWGDLVHVEERDWDAGTSWMNANWTFYARQGEDLVHKATVPISHRVYAPHELKRQVESAGWRTLGLFGSLAMEALVPDRPRVVLVARKGGK